MSEVERSRWRRSGFYADHFALTREHAWTRRQYRALLILESTERITTLANLDIPFHTALEDWITSGIPAERALLYRKAGLAIDVARDLEDSRATGEPIDQALETLLALRHIPSRRRNLKD